MEKVILALRSAGTDRTPDESWCTRLRGPVAQELLDIGLPGLAINVKDDVVRESLLTMTTLDQPVSGFVSLWTNQSYGDQVAAAVAVLQKECDDVFGYLVTESVPLAPPQTEPGERTAGFANVALLRRPAALTEETWRNRWHLDHTAVAIETQSIFGYTQNAVVRPLTPDAPVFAAIVEELFPAAGITDIKAFFGAADDDELSARITRMVASTTAFGANENVDVVPTSRYVFRSPFTTEAGS
jgi:hypothetical protein